MPLETSYYTGIVGNRLGPFENRPWNQHLCYHFTKRINKTQNWVSFYSTNIKIIIEYKSLHLSSLLEQAFPSQPLPIPFVPLHLIVLRCNAESSLRDIEELRIIGDILSRVIAKG